MRKNKSSATSRGLSAAALLVCGCFPFSAMGQEVEAVTIYEETFTGGSNSLTAVSGTSFEIVNERMEIDLGTRAGGTTFNTFSGPAIILGQLGLDPTTIESLDVEMELLTVGDNTELETAESFLANDNFAMLAFIRDVNGIELGRVELPRTTLADEFNYNVGDPFLVFVDDFGETYPTAATVQFQVFFRENAANPDDPEAGDVIGLDGNDIAIDNIRVFARGIKGDALEVTETTILEEDFEGEDAEMSEFRSMEL